MKTIFETAEYGRIEITRENSRGDSSGYVYFQKDDYETVVNADGTFLSQWETLFRVVWPTGITAGKDATLEITTPRTLGRSPVVSGMVSV